MKLFLLALCFSSGVGIGSTPARAQVRLDSMEHILSLHKEDTAIVNTLNAISVEQSNSSYYGPALVTANKALARATASKYKIGQAAAYHSIGWHYKAQYRYPEAFKNYFTSLRLMKETGDKKRVANTYLNIAGLYFNQGNYGEHLKNQYAALRIFEEISDKSGMATSLHGVGIVYIYLNNLSDALKNLDAALKLKKETGDVFGEAQCYNSMGEVHARQGNFQLALKNYFLAMNLFKRPGAPTWGVPLSHNHIGNVYLEQGESALEVGKKSEANLYFSKATAHFLASSKESQRAGSLKDVADAYVLLGNVQIKGGEFAEASNSLEKALGLFNRVKDKEGLKNSYYLFSTLDSIDGNYAQALLHYKMYTLYRDSLVNDEHLTKALDAKMQYALYKDEIEEQRKNNLQFFSLVILACLLLAGIVISLIVWRNLKQKKKAHLLLKKQKEELQITLTELQETQAQLIQREKMASLGELTAGISHEIQNPLNFINNFSDVNRELIQEMKDSLALGNQAEALLIANDIQEGEEKINRHGKRADAIIKSMLQHSRASTGKKETVDINGLADEYLRLSYHGLRAKDKLFNAAFTTHFDKTIGKIDIVPQDIGRVLLNLYNNAFFSVAQKKKQLNGAYEPGVVVTTRQQGGKIIVSVKDNGTGIPQKVLDKIYQPFFTTKPSGQGTGLGLSMSYDIIKAHGGDLKVETKEGLFAEFIICLPVK
ncbi:MAG: tetratricopeptide repeat protein [Chitinophagaceae bacterium]